MRALLVEDSVVTNIGEFETAADIFDGWIAAPGSEGIGWVDNGNGSFSEPSQPVIEPTTDELSDQRKRDGFIYNSTVVPVTNADAIGAMQMKLGFEDFGMTETNFHMSNGEVLPLTLAEWPTFAAEFFAARASFF